MTTSAKLHLRIHSLCDFLYSYNKPAPPSSFDASKSTTSEMTILVLQSRSSASDDYVPVNDTIPISTSKLVIDQSRTFTGSLRSDDFCMTANPT